jgi:hypothetical protein
LKRAAKCRPREVPDDLEPFTGDDGDADAIMLLLGISKKILDAIPREHRLKPFGEFMAREDIETLTAINHIVTYLDQGPAKYAEMADELRGYMVIE